MLALGGVAVAFAISWSIWPLPRVAPFDATLEEPESAGGEDEPVTLFARSAFAARIWNPPAALEAGAPVVTAAKPAPPPRLQLIGIVHDTAEDGSPLLRAALYDPDTDKLHIVASGEQIGVVTITVVDAKGVDLEASGRANRLVLREPDRAESDLPPALRRLGDGHGGDRR